MTAFFIFIWMFLNTSALAGKGWNNYFYKVVRSGGKLVSITPCQQSDRPLNSSIEGFRLVGKNVIEHKMKILENSMYTKVSYTVGDNEVKMHYFSGSVMDLHAHGMKGCKKHLKKRKKTLESEKSYFKK